MISVTCEAVDVTASSDQRHSLAVDRSTQAIAFTWTTDGREAGNGEVELSQWDAMLEQVRRHEPNRWASTNMSGPLGKNGMPTITKRLATTPTYQLFLASVDICDHLRLHQSNDPGDPGFTFYYLSRLFGELSGFITSASGTGRLFFVPDLLITEWPDEAEVLLANGKLGSVRVANDQEAIGLKYYVPYSVPSGFERSASKEARMLWDEVRDMYYSQR